MAGNSRLNLPGLFAKGKRYVMSGDTLLAWRSALVKDRVIAGPFLTENQTAQGRIFSANAQAVAAVLGCQALTVVDGRPGYYADPASDPAAGKRRVWVRMGLVNSVVPTSIATAIDLSGTNWVWLEASLSTTAERLEVTSVAIKSGASLPSWPAWGSNGELPTKMTLPLAYVPGAGEIENSGTGSFELRDVAAQLSVNTDGTTNLARQIIISRMGNN